MSGLVSALCGSTMTMLLPIPSSTKPLPKLHLSGGVTECSSRPQKKATAHHRKTRPRKSAPWDIRRGPAVYPPLPLLPPDWSYAATHQPSTDQASATFDAPFPDV